MIDQTYTILTKKKRPFPEEKKKKSNAKKTQREAYSFITLIKILVLFSY